MTRLAVIAGALVVSVIGVAALSWTAADGRAERERLDEQIETDRRIDNADVGRGDSDADLDWLHSRSKAE